MDKKAKKKIQTLNQRIQKLRQQLAGVRQQADEPEEIENPRKADRRSRGRNRQAQDFLTEPPADKTQVLARGQFPVS